MDRERIEAILGEDGLLAGGLGARYEYRPQQIEMALAVGAALEKKRSLVVEAATGTGKTLAYLVPALLSGRTVVISTGTKALQEQLFHKDIPFLQKHWDKPFRAAQLKGRRNYLCQLRFDQMLLQPKFRGRHDARHWPDIQRWAMGDTKTGDRAEIPGLPDDYPTWADLSVSSEGCLGSKCRHAETCFVNQARATAREAQLIVVNHHLFFADLALREQGFGEILPEYDAVIFDEAHHLESVASGYFGVQLSNWRVQELLADIRRTLDSEDIQDDDIDGSLKAVDLHATSLFTLMSFGLYDGRYLLDEALNRGKQRAEVEEAGRKLAEALTELDRELGRVAGQGEVPERLPERALELKFDLERLMRHDDERYTYFVELRDRGVFLQAAPIDLAELFRERLLSLHDSLIFTSATLATGGDFEFFKQRLGILPPEVPEDAPAPPKKKKAGGLAPGEPFEVEELILPPVFDYQGQCVLYVPRKMPEPKHPDFQKFVAQVVEYLLKITDGRAFVLFTSYHNMNGVYDLLIDSLSERHTVLRQGERPKGELLDRFRAEPTSVLFATSSFWEGVDVEGDALQMVIIDKLPFASPGDPLIKARMDLLESRGHNSFMEFSVPQAALTLKQGFGRLIRSRNDIGVVAVLDSRLARRRYGKVFLDTLPDVPVVWTAPEVKRWWHNLHAKKS